MLALLLACLTGIFWKVIFTTEMFYYRDVFNYTYPHAKFIQEMFQQGELPYWNPYLNYGQAVLANPNFLLFYPDTLLLAVLPLDFAYTFHYLLHFGLAGLGAYFLARRWRQSPAASFFAAFFFLFSGPVLSLGNFYNHVAAAAWIPWALLATDRALDSCSARAWTALTVVFTLQFLAGEPFTLVATFGLAVAYALFQRGSLERPLGIENRRIVMAFGAVGILMVALSSVQLFPAADLLQSSRRGVQGLPFMETAFWSFHPSGLLEAVFPRFYGDAIDAPTVWTWALNGPHGPYFPSIFIGFIPLFLGLAGWALAPDRRVHFLAAATLILLLLAFGKFTPIFPFAYLLNPLLGMVRFPVKLLVPIALLCALLAGWGYGALGDIRASRHANRRKILIPLHCLAALSGVVLVVSFIAPALIARPASGVLWTLQSTITAVQVEEAARYLVAFLKIHLPGLLGFSLGAMMWLVSLEKGKTWARGALLPLAIFGAVQLAAETYSVNPTVPKSFYAFRPPVLDSFETSDQPYRYCFLNRIPKNDRSWVERIPPQDFLNFDSLPEAARLPPRAQIAFRDRLVLARSSMLARLEGSLNFDVEGTIPPALQEFWLYIVRYAPEAEDGDCLLGRTNVRYQILWTPRPNDTLREIGPVFNGSAQPSALYENRCFVPRAYAVASARPSADSLSTLATLSSPEFDPHREVILAADAFPATSSESPESPGQVEFVRHHPNEVTLRAKLTRPGYVVLLDRYDQNWHAQADGREVRILRANHLFRAVHLEAGEHELRFFYRQRGLKEGAAVSLLAVLLLAAMCATGARWPVESPPANPNGT
jgi:hypothetical protein